MIRCAAGALPDKTGVELLHRQVVAVAHQGKRIFQMMPLGKFRVRTLGEAVADHAVGIVIVVKPHAERGGKPFDLFYANIIGFFEDPVSQPVIALPVQVEYLPEHIEAAEEGITYISLDLFPGRFVLLPFPVRHMQRK